MPKVREMTFKRMKTEATMRLESWVAMTNFGDLIIRVWQGYRKEKNFLSPIEVDPMIQREGGDRKRGCISS